MYHIISLKGAVSVLNFHQKLLFVWVPSGMVLDEEQNALQLHIVSVLPFVKAFNLISLWQSGCCQEIITRCQNL